MVAQKRKAPDVLGAGVLRYSPQRLALCQFGRTKVQASKRSRTQEPMSKFYLPKRRAGKLENQLRPNQYQRNTTSPPRSQRYGTPRSPQRSCTTDFHPNTVLPAYNLRNTAMPLVWMARRSASPRQSARALSF